MKKQIKKIAAFLLTLAVAFTLLPADVQAASSIKLNKSKVTIYTGGTTTLKVSGTSRKVSFTSSKKSVATVTSKGKITAKKPGTATITAKVGSKKLTCKVTVKKENPKLSKSKTTLYVGSTTMLKVSGTSRKVSFSSSNKSVAPVSSSGKVTAKKAGTATITAKVGSKKLTCKVTVKVKEPPKPVAKLSKTSDTVLISYSRKLSVSGNTGSVTWKSSNSSIATVDSKGVVTGKKAGTATITARVDGKNLTCKVTVPKYRLHVVEGGTVFDKGIAIVKKDIRKVVLGKDWLVKEQNISYRFGLSGTKSSDTVKWELTGSKECKNGWGSLVDRNAKAGVDGVECPNSYGYRQYYISNINDSSNLPFKNGSTELKVRINGKVMFTVQITSVTSEY